MSEESRAAQYRADWRRREAFQRALDRDIAGNPAALAALRLAWRPLIDRLRDWDPSSQATIDDDTRVDRV